MTAVHNSNPDAGRECIAVYLLNKRPTCLGLKSVAQKGLGDVGGKGIRASQLRDFPFPRQNPTRRVEKLKFEAEASESLKSRIWSVYKLSLKPRLQKTFFK